MNQIKITIENEKKEKLDIYLHELGSKDRLIDAIYPNKGIRGLSKGYIALVNHLFGEISELK